MANNWQPKKDDWIVVDGALATVDAMENDKVKAIFIKKILKEGFELKSNFDNARPAVLSDFAVLIGSHRYYYVNSGDNVIAYKHYDIGKVNPLTYYDKTSEYSSGELEAIIAHYNITVLDEATFKKLSEADNG